MRSLAGRTDHPVLAEMEAVAEKNNFPIVGRLVGVFLQTLAKTVGAENIFEFGSGYGALPIGLQKQCPRAVK